MRYKARLSFTVTLDLKVQAANEMLALAAVHDYENFLLSQKWNADKAPKAIKKITESLYFSKRELAREFDEPLDGIKLG